nr:rRNA biogenesis protein RRP5 [Cryptococcus depauperatus CBS 7855]
MSRKEEIGATESSKLVPRTAPAFTSALKEDETDFPRGGGSSLTAFEFKQVREEGRKEAEEDVKASKGEKRKRQMTERQIKRLKKNQDAKKEEMDKDTIRVEHLNHKRLVPGTRVLGRVHTIHPLHLILSLPNNLLAHVPITEISNTLTQLLTAEEARAVEEEEEEQESDNEDAAPDLAQLFVPGQYIPAKVLTLYPTASQSFVSQYPSTETIRLAARVELTLIPEKVNSEVSKKDLETGYFLTGEVKSEEDKGWTVGIGLNTDKGSSVEGFVSKEEVSKTIPSGTLVPGQLLPSIISSIAAGGRVYRLSLTHQDIIRSQISEVTTVGSIIPGHLVTSLITAVLPTGLNVKVAGFFDGTIDLDHLPLGENDVEERYKIGKKIRARVVYDNLATNARTFSLSALPHVLDLTSATQEGDEIPLEHAIAIGKTYQSVKVVRILKDWGVVVKTHDGLNGFVHISHLSDERVPILSSSAPQFKPGTLHRARVIGHSPMDGVLLFSFEQSILSQTFMQVSELQIGQVLKGTVRKLTDKCLFINVHGNVDGVVYPNHYADIRLKQPQKRFKPGSQVKAKVLYVEPTRSRVVLTLKKTFVESDVSMPQNIQDVYVGQVTLASVLKIVDKGLEVELFGKLRAFIPHSECSQTYVKTLSEAFYVGKPLTIRVILVDTSIPRIVASVKQAIAVAPATAAEKLSVGDVISGKVEQIHTEQVVVKLDGLGLTALLSLSNLSNQRHMGIEEIRDTLKIGEKIQNLVVVSKNPISGLIIVNIKKAPTAKAVNKEDKSASGISVNVKAIDSIQPGQVIDGTVLEPTAQGWMVKIGNNLRGRVHLCDAADDFSLVSPSRLWTRGQQIKCYVINVDKAKRVVDLSTRKSRVEVGETDMVDKEINTVTDLKEGQQIRGFVKNIAESGVFVSLGRNYVKDWKSRFTLNDVVSGKILSINPTSNSIEVTLRKTPSRQPKKIASLTLADFAEGQKVVASVRKIEAYGMFLRIDGSDVSGLCHKSEITDNKKADVGQALKGFRIGDQVKAKVTHIDRETGKISFGIKASYFGEELEEEDKEMENDYVESESGNDSLDGDAAMESEEESGESGHEDEETSEDIIGEGEEAGAPCSKPKPKSTPQTALYIDSFSWSGDVSAVEPESESEDENEEGTLTQTKNKSKNVDLTASAPFARPTSISEYERALLASPNSSYLWIQYMSFHLQLHEIEKARKIGRQALEKIPYREEEEKLNVWMALINLEIGFGTAQSAEKVSEEAAQYNDKRTVYMRYAEALQAARKDEAAEEVMKKIIKKFSSHPESWTRLSEFYLSKGNTEAARALLPRSMKSLDKSKHVETIEKIALLDFNYGDAERGKTLFEGLVDRFPKRLDLWGVYIDQVAKTRDIQGVRGLIERALAQKLNSKRAKFLFKKWLNIEQRIGDVDGQEKAKTKAREWVQANTEPIENESEDEE